MLPGALILSKIVATDAANVRYTARTVRYRWRRVGLDSKKKSAEVALITARPPARRVQWLLTEIQPGVFKSEQSMRPWPSISPFRERSFT